MTATVCGPCDDAFQDTNTREPFENDDATKGEPWDEASGDGFDDVFQSEDRLGEAMFDAPQTDPDRSRRSRSYRSVPSTGLQTLQEEPECQQATPLPPLALSRLAGCRGNQLPRHPGRALCRFPPSTPPNS